jgi:hypothetical protein
LTIYIKMEKQQIMILRLFLTMFSSSSFGSRFNSPSTLIKKELFLKDRKKAKKNSILFEYCAFYFIWFYFPEVI